MNSIAHFIFDVQGLQFLGVCLLMLGFVMWFFSNFFKKRKINNLSYSSSVSLLMIVGALLLVRLYLVAGIIVAVLGMRSVYKRFKHKKTQSTESGVQVVRIRA